MNKQPFHSILFTLLTHLPLVRGKALFISMFSGLAVCCLIGGPEVAAAQTGAAGIGRTIEQKQTEMKTHERLLRGLSEKERQLFGDLQQLEARISRTEGEVTGLEKELAQLRQAEKGIQEDYRKLDQARMQTAHELRKLLEALWPVHLRGLEQNMQNMGTWHEADRQFAWLGRLYAMVQDRVAALQVQGNWPWPRSGPKRPGNGLRNNWIGSIRPRTDC